MAVANLDFPARLGVMIAVGLASLVVFFTAGVVLLGQTGRLDYHTGISTLLTCCIGGIAVAADVGFGPWRPYFTGDRRERFVTIATWASVLLPVATFAETALDFTMGYWWFFFPAQFVVGGLLGIAAASTRSRLWWLRGVWGITAIVCGALWVVTVLFWAK
jgi:4-amino-4-deoxy-L-arabinose transferase-like glycosyltransferase